MEKVRLTAEQIKAIQKLRDSGWHADDSGIIRDHAISPKGWNQEYSSIHDISLDTLIKALYIGYEELKLPKYKVGDKFTDEYGGYYEVIYVTEELDSSGYFGYLTKVIDEENETLFESCRENELSYLEKSL